MAIHVLFLAAEAEPYVKIGGLGDVAGALPNAIHQVSKDSSPDQQVDIRMVLPYHFAIKQKGFETTLLGKFDVPSKMGLVECQVYAVKKMAFRFIYSMVHLSMTNCPFIRPTPTLMEINMCFSPLQH